MLLTWWRAVTAVAVVAVLLLLTATPAAAQKPPPPPAEMAIADADGDKIFDDLEQLLAPAPSNKPFPVLVVLRQAMADQLDALSQRIGPFQTTYEYPSINGFAATLTKRQISTLAALDSVRQIESERIVRPTLDQATLWFGVQKARADFGLDGNADGSPSYSADDVVIAVLDTGIDTGHVDLDGGKVLAWKDFINDQPDPYDEGDECGYHGTHVSSTAVGEGQGNAALKGVAPGAALVGVKVLGIQAAPPGPQDCVGSTSQVNAGIQWVIDNKDTYNIRVMNMSLNAPGCSNGQDSQSLLVNSAVAAGIVAALAAGNEGPGTCTIGSPSAAQDAITVAAMADPSHDSAGFWSCGPKPAGGFYLACFSSRGPTLDGRTKPDIAAPGVLVKAAAGGTTNDYTNKSGTSMASPFVAGTAALMVQADPTLTPSQVKSIITSTAVDWGPSGKDIDYGAGRLDAYEAIRTAAGAAGTNIAVPNHQFLSAELEAAGQAGDTDTFTIEVTDPTKPIAITLVMATWTSNGDIDFDMELLDKDGTRVGLSETASRQETIGITTPSNGPYTLRVYAFSGSGFDSEGGPYFFDASVGGTVSAANEPPTADDQPVSTDEETNLTITPTGSDPNGDPLTFIITSLPANGSLRDGPLDTDPLIASIPHTLASDQARYQPNPDFNGPDSFTFKTNDGTVDSNTATVSITVNPVNDAPVVDTGPDQETAVGQAFNLTATYTDPDVGDSHSCTIDWGDGSPTEDGTVDQNLDTCSGNHTYATTLGSPFTVTVTVTDSAAPTPALGSDQLVITVTDADSDSDGDGVLDALDNCPAMSNPDQTNSDADLEAAGATVTGDSLGDACDDDDDNDSLGVTQDPGTAATACAAGAIPLWADCVESYLGTGGVDNCTGSPGPGGDAWPPDIDQNGRMSGGDVFAIFPFWLSATARYDVNADGTVSGGDVFLLFPLWLTDCN